MRTALIRFARYFVMIVGLWTIGKDLFYAGADVISNYGGVLATIAVNIYLIFVIAVLGIGMVVEAVFLKHRQERNRRHREQ